MAGIHGRRNKTPSMNLIIFAHVLMLHRNLADLSMLDVHYVIDTIKDMQHVERKKTYLISYEIRHLSLTV